MTFETTSNSFSSSSCLNPFTSWWCGSDNWGPWDTRGSVGRFTYCSISLIVSIIRVLILPVIITRYIQASQSGTAAKRQRSIKFRIQLICTVLLAALSNIELLGVLLIYKHEQIMIYNVVTSALGSVCWICSAFLMVEERARFLPHHLLTQFWWCFELFSMSLCVPTLAEDYKYSWHLKAGIFVIVPKVVLLFILCSLLLIKQQAKYFHPNNLETAASTMERPTPSIIDSSKHIEHIEPTNSGGSIQVNDGEEGISSYQPLFDYGSVLQQQEEGNIIIPTSTIAAEEDNSDEGDGENEARRRKRRLIRNNAIAASTSEATQLIRGKDTAAVNAGISSGASFISKLLFSFTRNALEIPEAYCRVSDEKQQQQNNMEQQTRATTIQQQVCGNDRAANLYSSFEKLWERCPKELPKQRLLWVIKKLFGKQIVVSGFLKLLTVPLQIAPCLFVYLMAYLSNSADLNEERFPMWLGFLSSILIFICITLCSLLSNHCYFESCHTALRIRSVLTISTFRKCFDLSSLSSINGDSILNRVGTDSEIIYLFTKNIHHMWNGPLIAIISITLLFQLLGWTSIIGIMVLLIFALPANFLLTSKIGKSTYEATKQRTLRLEFLNQVLSAIRSVKLSAWELVVLKRLSEDRRKEMKYCLSLLLSRSFVVSIAWAGPLIGIVLIVITKFYLTKARRTSTPSMMSGCEALTMIALINLLNSSLISILTTFGEFSSAKKSFNRISDLLTSHTNNQQIEQRVSPVPDSPVILFEGASFAAPSAPTS